jgi:inorganic pyrophosphatase
MNEGELTVVIDVPRGSFVKRDDNHDVDFISPLPCPFNYGHVPGTLGADGEALDALVLGPRLPLGSTVKVTTRACVDFIDGGRPDPKWICAQAPLSRLERLWVVGFFRGYAVAKRLINRIRGKQGQTRYRGWL